MPLKTENKRIWPFYCLYNSIRTSSGNPQPPSSRFYGLMVIALYGKSVLFSNPLKKRVLFNTNLMNGTLFMNKSIINLRGNVLIKRASKENVYELHPAADAENGYTPFQRLFQHNHLRFGSFKPHGSEVRMRLLVIEFWVYIPTALAEKPINSSHYIFEQSPVF